MAGGITTAKRADEVAEDAARIGSKALDVQGKSPSQLLGLAVLTLVSVATALLAIRLELSRIANLAERAK